MAKFTVFCCILAAQVLSGATLYVVPPGTAGNTPTPPYNSPATAANDLATAVGAAANGDTILVRKGTYSFACLDKLTTDKELPVIRSYDPDNGDAVNAAETIFDGTGFAGTDAAIMVDSLTWMHKDNKFTIEGFTFTNFPCTVLHVNNTDYFGKVAGCVFADNGGTVNGGAIRFYDCKNCVVTNCTFSGNVAIGANGGAICHERSNVNLITPISVIDCSFYGGDSAVANRGGAIYALTQILVSHCTFRDLIVDHGTATSRGAAIYSTLNGVISDSMFCGTLRARYGQAIEITTLSTIVSNCTFTGISSSGDPTSASTAYGLVHCASGASFEISCCSFTNNASIANSIIFCEGVPSTSVYALTKDRCVRNCLVAGNLGSVRLYGPHNSSDGYSIDFDNCTVLSTAFPNTSDSPVINFRNSILQTMGTAANATVSFANCITTTEALATEGLAYVSDPGFRNAAGGDYALKRRSPCRDAGAVLDWMDASSVDIVGLPRVVTDGRSLASDPSALPDIGCYENGELPLGLSVIVR